MCSIFANCNLLISIRSIKTETVFGETRYFFAVSVIEILLLNPLSVLLLSLVVN